jgi:hypothetical protein
MSATIEATIPLQPTPSRSANNPFEAARLKLVRRLLEMRAPAPYPNFPSPADHEGIAGHIREAAQIFDEWLAAIGSEVRDNAVTSISKDLFSGSFMGAVDGNETWACESQGEALIGFAAERRAR